MSKKFTGITSAGSAIPVYDKDAHSALGQKLDTSAFSSVSGEFATVDDVVAAVSGKADTANIIYYDGKPSANPIYAYSNEFYGVDSIVGSGVSIDRSNLYLSGTVTASTGGFTANGISAGPQTDFAIRGQGESLKAGFGAGFTFSSVNTAFGTAQLTTAGPNQIVQTYSPKFEVRNVSGAGFSIEGSGARGYDASGNVVWDTYNPPAPTQLIAGADSPKPSILLSPYMPKSMSAQFSNAPLFSADGYGIYIGISGQYLKALMNGLTARNSLLQAELADSSGHVSGNSTMNGGEVSVYHSSAFGSANSGTWTLTQSVQKREIECDSATSAITAIAGSAVGGGSTYSAGDNIDITDEVISGKDWSEDIASATSGLMQTSGLEYDGDKISGYMGSAFKAGTDLEFEYDSADNISAINSSAISTTPSQALYAKSPLYAGVSGTSSFIGVDETLLSDMVEQVASANYNETVLWSGNSTGSGFVFELSGNISDYNYIEMYGTDVDGWCGYAKTPTEYFTTANRIPIVTQHYGTQTKNIIMRGMYVHPTSDTSLDSVSFGFDYAGTANPNSNFSMKRIVGIGRKEA